MIKSPPGQWIDVCLFVWFIKIALKLVVDELIVCKAVISLKLCKLVIC